MKKQFILACILFAVGTCDALSDSLKMQIDGKDWAATVVNSKVLKMGTLDVLSISGKFETDKISSLSFQIAPGMIDAPSGHYELKSGLLSKGGASGLFNQNLVAGDPMEDSYYFQAGALDVTSYDAASHILSGTFAGQLANQTGTKTVTVRNGVLDKITIVP